MKPLEPIVCQRCKERRPPIVRHGMFCEKCWREIEAEADARSEGRDPFDGLVDKPAPSMIFGRKDGSIHD